MVDTNRVRGRKSYQSEQVSEKQVDMSDVTKIRGIGKIVKKELCPFTMKLSAMMDAGLPVLQCVEALEEQTDNIEFKKVCRGIYKGVESGTSFADSLLPYGKIFNELYIKMVNAGEQSGDLPAVCSKLADYMEKSAAIRRKVKSAMMYPVIVMIIAVILTLGLVRFVVPVFADMFSGFGDELPKPTQILMSCSDFLQNHFLILILAVAAVIYGFKAYKNTKGGRYTLDRYFMNMPLFGNLVTKVVVGRCCRTFSSLLQSGMPILQAVEIMAETSGNKYIEEAIEQVHIDIENGNTLTEAFKRTERFPSMVVHMMRAGEKTARIEQMLDKVSDFYDDEVDDALEGLSSILEPLLMVGIGSVVGTIVICMFLPIFKMGSAVGG